jgi:N-acetylglucosamine-6-phosphate deacetylase
MLCIYNARLVLLDRIVDRGWVLVKNDLISEIGQGIPPEGLEQVDARGLTLAPGFIDLHVHGGAGADFLSAAPEAFQKAADFHISGGTTSICPTAATATYDDFESFLEVWEIAKSKSNVRLLPVHLEGPHLAPSKAGAQNAKLMRPPSAEQKDWILARAQNISQITIAPELPGALQLIDAVTRAGVVMSAGHT